MKLESNCHLLIKFPKMLIGHTMDACTIINLTISQTTNFRHFQFERVCRRQFQAYWKWQNVLQTGKKHCGKRRNCSLRASSPFFRSVFKRLVLQTHKNQGLFGKGLNAYMYIILLYFQFFSQFASTLEGDSCSRTSFTVSDVAFPSSMSRSSSYALQSYKSESKTSIRIEQDQQGFR